MASMIQGFTKATPICNWRESTFITMKQLVSLPTKITVDIFFTVTSDLF